VLAGLPDLTNLRNVSPALVQVVTCFVVVAPEKNPGVGAQSSPDFHVKPFYVPTLLFHGNLDSIVPYQELDTLKTKIKSFNVITNCVF
jgi:hypothetical protein